LKPVAERWATLVRTLSIFFLLVAAYLRQVALPNAGRPQMHSGEHRCGADRDKNDYDHLIHGMRVAHLD
jgi:hypothetical protein